MTPRWLPPALRRRAAGPGDRPPEEGTGQAKGTGWRRPGVSAAALALLLLAVPLLVDGAVGPPGQGRAPGSRPAAGADRGLLRAGARFFPLRPVALVTGATVEAGETREVQVAGTPSGVPAEGVAAIAVNVEVATGARAATVTLLPGTSQPATPAATPPAVAAGASSAASALAIQRLSPTGQLGVRSAGGSARVTLSVRGYYAARCDGAGAAWRPAEPALLLDTTLQPSGTATIRATPGAPATGDVDALALAVDASGVRAAGHLQVHPAGTPPPDGASLALTPGRDAGVVELAQPGAGGAVTVTNRSSGPVRVRVRLVGHHLRGAGHAYQPAAPTLLLDTMVRPGSPVGVRVAGAGGLPAGSGVATAALTLRATGAATATRLDLASRLGGPAVATLGLRAGEPALASALPRPGPDGRVWLTVAGGDARVLVWARGWYGEPTRFNAEPDRFTFDVFNRQGVTEPGWTSGSISAPVRLPDGTTAWLFGEAFLGTLRPDGSHPPRTPGPPRGRGPFSVIVHNSIVTQDDTRLTTHHGPVDRATGLPDALLHPPGADEDRWYWPSNGLVEGGMLRVFVQEIRRLPDDWFAWTGRNRLVSLRPPGMTVVADDPLPGTGQGSSVQWGAAVLEEAGHTYVYGVEELGPSNSVKRTHVARFPRGRAGGDWQFWDGAAWVTDPAASAPLTGPAGTDPLSAIPGTVARLGASYVLLSIADLGTTIDARTSCSPTGPWSPARPLYRIPELLPASRPGDRAILARGHPSGDGLLVAYSLNADGLTEAMRRATYYRPRYVRVW